MMLNFAIFTVFSLIFPLVTPFGMFYEMARDTHSFLLILCHLQNLFIFPYEFFCVVSRFGVPPDEAFRGPL